jgi:hypothetical protein
MSRGRPKEEVVERPRKYTRVFEKEDCTTTWYYDLDIALSPVRVDVKWHKSPAQMKAEAKITKEEKKNQVRSNKFFKFKAQQNEAKSTVSKSTKRKG